jgi:pimeloyl-ACP methyl ester carboxylesterase
MVLRWYRASNPDAYVGWDTALLAATASTPKQVLWGDLDPFIPAATADRFGTTDVQHFADDGHWLMIENPEASAASIAKLVAAAS